MSLVRMLAVGATAVLLAVANRPVHGQVVINEVMADNNSAVRNGDGYPKSYVELYNTATTNVSLNGWYLTDSTNLLNRTKYAFPPGTEIQANEYLVVWCDSPTNAQGGISGPGLYSGFTLRKRTDDVALYRGPTNALVLVDYVKFGFQISDMPVSRIPDATGPWKLANPTPGYENGEAVPLGNTNLLRFNEWLANSPFTDDWFEIYNYSTNPPVDMGGMTIHDGGGLAAQKLIPPLSFINSNGFQLFWATGNNSDDANECNFRLGGDSGDLLTLRPSYNSPTYVHQVIIFPQALDTADGYLPDGNTNNVVSFATGKYTPGDSNFQLITNVVFNEILAHTDPPFVDAVEFYNPTTNAVRLDYYYLSNNKDNPRKYQFPTNTVVPPLGFLVVYENAFNPDGTGNSPSFTLNSARGDEVVLCSATNLGGALTGFRLTRTFGASENGVPWGRVVKSDGKTDLAPMPYQSLGTSLQPTDNPALTNLFVTGTGAVNPYPAVGPIVISEIMYHPTNIIEGTNILDNTLDEYIELSNFAATNAYLFNLFEITNRWQIKGGVDFEFPSGITIPSSGCVLVVNFDPSTNAAQLAAWKAKYNVPAEFTRIYGPYKGKLANASMRLDLVKPDFVQKPPHPDAGLVPQIVMEKVTYEDQLPWPTNKVDGGGWSLHRKLDRYANDEVNWFAAEPTPGRFDSGPSITEHPQNVTTTAGSTANFFGAAQGTAPVTFQWLFNGSPLTGQTQTNLVIMGVTETNLGQYSLVASNPLGVVTSQVASLAFSAVPVISQQPEDQNVIVGTDVAIFVTASGGGTLAYQWQHNGQDLAGQTDSGLILLAVGPNQAGGYRVVITNSFGSVTSLVASLTVADKPSILPPVRQPDGGFRLTFATQPGFTYVVEGSSNLSGWTDLQTFPNAGTNVTYTYYSTNRYQFFRARLTQ